MKNFGTDGLRSVSIIYLLVGGLGVFVVLALFLHLTPFLFLVLLLSSIFKYFLVIPYQLYDYSTTQVVPTSGPVWGIVLLMGTPALFLAFLSWRAVGWIEQGLSKGKYVWIALISLAIGFTIWNGFYVFNKDPYFDNLYATGSMADSDRAQFNTDILTDVAIPAFWSISYIILLYVALRKNKNEAQLAYPPEMPIG